MGNGTGKPFNRPVRAGKRQRRAICGSGHRPNRRCPPLAVSSTCFWRSKTTPPPVW